MVDIEDKFLIHQRNYCYNQEDIRVEVEYNIDIGIKFPDKFPQVFFGMLFYIQ